MLEILYMKFSQLIDQYVFAENGYRVGKVKDVVIDAEECIVTHLVLELTKQASEEILGSTPALFDLPRNTLAISALEKGVACCTENGVELKVSKGQLPIYLRPE
jgi:sporulation protein YlmC with PRC-barrel domain